MIDTMVAIGVFLFVSKNIFLKCVIGVRSLTFGWAIERHTKIECKVVIIVYAINRPELIVAEQGFHLILDKPILPT